MVKFEIVKDKVMYFYAPKCGSRTIIGWAGLIKNPSIYQEHPEWFSESRLDDYKELGELTPIFHGSGSGHDVRFCVVREPVGRFISAYTNRILYHEKMEKISIAEFIDTIDEQRNEDVLSHIYPLSYWYGEDPTFYTHIFNLRHMDGIKFMLEFMSGISLPNLQLQQSGGIEKPTLTKVQEDWIRERYKQDYEIFGKWF
jgi:hypothetical protein